MSTEDDLRVVQFDPKDEELTEMDRMLNRYSIQLIIPIREMNRYETDAIGEMLEVLGRGIRLNSKVKHTLDDLHSADTRLVKKVREKLLVYRNKGQARANKRGNQE